MAFIPNFRRTRGTRFCETLDKLYWRSKNERRAGFETVSKLVAERQKEESCGRYTDHQKEQAVKHDKRGNDHYE